MAFIGEVFIAGSESLEGKFKSGISFLMSQNSPLTYIHETDNGDWQVEFSKSSNIVVARTTGMLSFDDLQSLGFNAIQCALDILSVKNILSTNLENPATENNGVYYSNEKSIAYVYQLIDFQPPINSKITLFDASGKEVKHRSPPEPIWNESFRYYRLSQSSTDLFEAYRNLFLAFESLLNNICPINSCKAKIKPVWLYRLLVILHCPKKWIEAKGEKEVTWLKRCLKIVNSKTNLNKFTPTRRENPVKYIIKSQYIDIRCKLQHAKFPFATLPHSLLSPTDVKQAYSELVRIWRQIAIAYFDIPIGGGLIITNEGFEIMMTNALQDQVKVYYTPDNSQPLDEDTEVSPRGESVYEFSSSYYKGKTRPKMVRIIAYEGTSPLSEQYEKPIYRICSKINTLDQTNVRSIIIGLVYIEHGFVVSGVDVFEHIQDFKLINKSQPSTEFNT